MRSAECGMRSEVQTAPPDPHSAFRIPHSAFGKARSLMPKIDILMEGSSVNTDVGIIGFCSVVLVEGEKRVLFDSAHVGRRTYLEAQLQVRGLTPRDIDLQVLSHAHWDH